LALYGLLPNPITAAEGQADRSGYPAEGLCVWAVAE